MDPDQGVRRQALSTLISQADLLPDANVQQALHDPSDKVRAQAVVLAAARGDRDLIHLLPLLSVRRSPLTQAAALGVIPDMVAAGGGPTEEQFTTALHAVADLESSPNEDERQPLTELALGIGVGRIADVLGVGDDRHLGACRLLWLEGSVASLRGLAAQLGDPIEEIRNMAAQAATKVAEMEAAAAPPPEPAGSSPVEQAVDGETILAFARALEDPEDSVRGPAAAALNGVERSAIAGWAVDALRGEDPEVAKLGAEVAGLRGLSETVGDVLDRGASVQGERQEPYRKALSALQIDAETLVGSLSSVAPERRPHAVGLLWEVAQRDALPLLERSLNDPSPDVRIAVLEVLGNSADPGAMEAAGRVLAADSASAVRVAAIGVLARGTDEQRLASLTQALSDPDPVVRAEAASMLPVGLAREAIEPLTRALNDLDERVWRASLPHLASFRADDLQLVWTVLTAARPEQREGFIAALEHADAGKAANLALEHVQSPNPPERELALTLAGRGSSDACVQACVAALQDPVAAVRLVAAASLGTLKSPGSVKALGASLSDPDATVRVAAVRSLGVIDSEAVLGFLVMALQDPSTDVREAASQVLTEWSSPAVARRLAGVLATPALEQQATDLLVKMGSSATELLVDVLLHSRPEMRPKVGRLLERIVGTDHFAARLGSTDPHQRRRSMIAVGGIGGPSAVEIALGALGDPDQGVRIAALEALGELGDPRTADQVARCSESDPVPEVVEAARQAVAKLQPGR
jgi:HEAT repeat protein